MQTDLSCGIGRNFQWIRDLKAKIVSDASEHPASKFLSFCCTETFVLERRLYRLYRTQFLSFCCCCCFFVVLFFFFFGLILLYSQDETFASTVNFGLAWLMFNLDPNTNIDKHLVNRVSKSHEFDF